MDNHLDREAFDAALHLLDRQVVDRDGLLVCKVDDLEITFYDHGSPPAVTPILTGPAALVPRMSGRTGHLLRRRWISLGVQYADRDVPLAIDLRRVKHIGSGVELDASRTGLLDRQPHPAEGTRVRRMGELIGMRVESDHPELRGQVLDVRLEPVGDRLVLRHFVDYARLGNSIVVPKGNPHHVVRLADLTGMKVGVESGTTLKRLKNIAENPAVAVVVDRYDEDWSRLGWVMLHGRAEILIQGTEHDDAQRLLARTGRRRRHPRVRRRRSSP